METPKNHTKVIPSKGTRLKWPTLKEVKPIILTPELTKGKRVTANEMPRNGQKSNNFLVP